MVVDDGVDVNHPDLNLNSYVAWNTDGDLVHQASVSADVEHGTACAGIIGAIADNQKGGCGAAPGTMLHSAALLSAPSAYVFDAAEAESLDHFPNADIHTNSWGPPDNLYYYTMGPYYSQALERARLNGRGGKGKVILFAAGNGGRDDNSNHDPYTAHRYTIAVGAVTDSGTVTWYSEPGACILIAAPSNGGAKGIVTTDAVADAGYTDTNATFSFGGTSAATPLVAAIVALVLEARPELTWRDVQGVLALSATKNDPTDIGWNENGAGHWVHPFYGFGMVDAAAAVNLASTWELLGPEVSVLEQSFVPSSSDNILSDDGPAWIGYVYVESPILVETAEIYIDIVHSWRGDLMITLISRRALVVL